jgi:hypothetical protein
MVNKNSKEITTSTEETTNVFVTTQTHIFGDFIYCEVLRSGERSSGRQWRHPSSSSHIFVLFMYSHHEFPPPPPPLPPIVATLTRGLIAAAFPREKAWTHGLTNYIDNKAKCRYLKNLPP